MGLTYYDWPWFSIDMNSNIINGIIFSTPQLSLDYHKINFLHLDSITEVNHGKTQFSSAKHIIIITKKCQIRIKQTNGNAASLLHLLRASPPTMTFFLIKAFSTHISLRTTLQVHTLIKVEKVNLWHVSMRKKLKQEMVQGTNQTCEWESTPAHNWLI